MSDNRELALRVEGLSKAYHLGHPLRTFFGGSGQSFKALDDISLEVKRGEVVGLVGPNGCGKTTLLKCIAGLLPIDRGRIEIYGKVTALLAMGVGISQEMSGRDNIYYSALLLGMSPAEVQAKTEDIITFADIGAFIDQPLRTYSSGMRARLLFAISMSVVPDILIVDEALATGDAAFLSKSSRRIRELCASGATIFFVSHNLHQVLELCDRALLMQDGRILEDGEPGHIVGAYNKLVFDSERSALRKSDTPTIPMLQGSAAVEIAKVVMRDGAGQATNGFYTGDPVSVDLHFRRNDPIIKELDVFVGILQGASMNYVGAFNTSSGLRADGPTSPVHVEIDGDEGVVRIDWSPLLLTTNDYSLWVMLYAGRQTFCEYRGVSPFFVARKDDVTDRYGYFCQPGEARLLKRHTDAAE